MDFDTTILLILVGIAAALYSSVGQGGGSGYLAAMVLLGLAPEVMKPSALAMNVAVTALSLGIMRGWKVIPGKLFLPLTLSSIPTALIGGYYLPSSAVYAYLVGGSLLVASLSLFRGQAPRLRSGSPSGLQLSAVGATLGLVSGLSGVGGGIFLGPIVLLAGWAELSATLAMTAAFILLNSAAALVGFGLSGLEWPAELPAMIVSVLLGAFVGTCGARKYLGSTALRRILGSVLLFSAIRMLVTA